MVRCRTLRLLGVGTSLLAAAALGCQKAPPPAASGRIENPALGIALLSLPEDFRLEVNEGDTLRFVHPGRKGSGYLTFDVGPEQYAGVNLVDEVWAAKEEFEARPEGHFLGQVELRTPIGTVFTVRGRFVEDGKEMEEFVALAVHPSANRLFTITYSYPAGGDTKERRDHLLAILGEVEGIGLAEESAIEDPP